MAARRPIRWLDRKNDPDWCQKIVAPVLGVAFLALGVLELSDGRSGFNGYWHIIFGFVWIIMGFVHASRWRRKKRAYERALQECFE